MARVLVLIFFVIGGVGWAVTFSVYAFNNPDMVEIREAFTNPDLVENWELECWARNDFYVPVSGPPVEDSDGEIIFGTGLPTWDEMNVNTTMI